jgi:hypothetical protein
LPYVGKSTRTVRKLSSSMLVAVGGMVINVPDEVELNRMMAEYPLILYLEMDVRQ